MGSGGTGAGQMMGLQLQLPSTKSRAPSAENPAKTRHTLPESALVRPLMVIQVHCESLGSILSCPESSQRS